VVERLGYQEGGPEFKSQHQQKQRDSGTWPGGQDGPRPLLQCTASPKEAESPTERSKANAVYASSKVKSAKPGMVTALIILWSPRDQRRDS
jgi:hypothetical protein